MVLDLFVLLLALVAIVLGIRGTYASFLTGLGLPVQRPTAPSSGPTYSYNGPTVTATNSNGQPVKLPTGGGVYPNQTVVAPPTTPIFTCDSSGCHCSQNCG